MHNSYIQAKTEQRAFWSEVDNQITSLRGPDAMQQLRNNLKDNLKNHLETKLDREIKDFMDRRFHDEPTSYSIWTNYKALWEKFDLELDISKLYHGINQKLVAKVKAGGIYWSSPDLYDTILGCIEASQARALEGGKRLWRDAPGTYRQRIQSAIQRRERDEAERRRRHGHQKREAGRRGGGGGGGGRRAQLVESLRPFRGGRYKRY